MDNFSDLRFSLSLLKKFKHTFLIGYFFNVAVLFSTYITIIRKTERRYNRKYF